MSKIILNTQLELDIKIPVLDKGVVSLNDFMVKDPVLKVVNSARVSFGKEVTEITEKDIKLIQYLYNHQHFSTFRHSYFTHKFKIPLFVARQFWKHQIGCEWIESDCFTGSGSINLPSTSWNEVSGRYIEFLPEFYIPSELRKQSTNNKQGSSNEIVKELYQYSFYDEQTKKSVEISPVLLTTNPVQFFEDSCMRQFRDYEILIKNGVAKEMARMILPQNLYSECILTWSLQAILYFLHLRLAPTAQFEIREYAKAVYLTIKPILETMKIEIQGV
jgi:thymidylate synthase (FAD)